MRFLFLAIQLFLQEAHTPEEQTLGLMGVSQLADTDGMLFIFPTPEYRTFWSYGCLIPLDVGFLDENLILREIVPLPVHSFWQTQKPLRSIVDLKKALQSNNSAYCMAASKCQYRYVIELPAGWFVRHNVAPGARLLKHGATYRFF